MVFVTLFLVFFLYALSYTLNVYVIHRVAIDLIMFISNSINFFIMCLKIIFETNRYLWSFISRCGVILAWYSWGRPGVWARKTVGFIVTGGQVLPQSKGPMPQWTVCPEAFVWFIPEMIGYSHRKYSSFCFTGLEKMMFHENKYHCRRWPCVKLIRLRVRCVVVITDMTRVPLMLDNSAAVYTPVFANIRKHTTLRSYQDTYGDQLQAFTYRQGEQLVLLFSPKLEYGY